ncbi:MAG TPA: hypothetical protein VGU23_05395 [Acidobacteriaceae bacterium]|nr:hypothetical protein [Acidobacteriaceae bacterium]
MVFAGAGFAWVFAAADLDLVFAGADFALVFAGADFDWVFAAADFDFVFAGDDFDWVFACDAAFDFVFLAVFVAFRLTFSGMDRLLWLVRLVLLHLADAKQNH